MEVMKINYDKRLMEVSKGRLEGNKTPPETYVKFFKNPHKYGGESEEDVCKRIYSFLEDIKNGRLFAIFDDDNPNKLVGVCAVTYYEEDYSHLYEGHWLTELPYVVMHRVALKKEYRNTNPRHTN